MIKRLSNLLAVYVDAVARSWCVVRGEPVLRVFVVKGPWRDDDEECEGGAGETNVKREFDVLLRETNEKGNDLGCERCEACVQGSQNVHLQLQAAR